MPRSQQSMESRILEWFKHAPLAVAVLVLGLAKDAVKGRQPKSATPAKPMARKKVATAAPAKVAAHPTPNAKAAARVQKRKKRPARKAQRGQAAVGTGGASLDDLGDGPDLGEQNT